MNIKPIHIPAEWDDNDLVFFEEFCDLIRVPRGTARCWRAQGRGPTWSRFGGHGRLYTTVGEIRRFVRGSAAHAPSSEPVVRSIQTH